MELSKTRKCIIIKMHSNLCSEADFPISTETVHWVTLGFGIITLGKLGVSSISTPVKDVLFQQKQYIGLH